MSDQAQTRRELFSTIKAIPRKAWGSSELFPSVQSTPRQASPARDPFSLDEANARSSDSNSLTQPWHERVTVKAPINSETTVRHTIAKESRIANTSSQAIGLGRKLPKAHQKTAAGPASNRRSAHRYPRHASRSGKIQKIVPPSGLPIARPENIYGRRGRADISQSRRRGRRRSSLKASQDTGTLFGEEYDNHFQLKFFTFKSMNQVDKNGAPSSTFEQSTQHVPNPLTDRAKSSIVTELNKCLADRANDILRFLADIAPVTLAKCEKEDTIDLSNASDLVFLELRKRILRHRSPGKKQDSGPVLPPLSKEEIDYLVHGTEQLFEYERNQVLSMLRAAVPVFKYGIHVTNDMRAWLPTMPLTVQHVFLKYMRKREEELNFELRGFARAVEEAVQNESTDEEGNAVAAE